MDGDDVVVGVASAPALGRRWWAGRGEGAFADGEPIAVSSVDSLDETHLAHAGVGTFYAYGGGDALVALTQDVWRSRGLGDFWMHCLVAECGQTVLSRAHEDPGEQRHGNRPRPGKPPGASQLEKEQGQPEHCPQKEIFANQVEPVGAVIQAA